MLIAFYIKKFLFFFWEIIRPVDKKEIFAFLSNFRAVLRSFFLVWIAIISVVAGKALIFIVIADTIMITTIVDELDWMFGFFFYFIKAWFIDWCFIGLAINHLELGFILFKCSLMVTIVFISTVHKVVKDCNLKFNKKLNK